MFQRFCERGVLMKSTGTIKLGFSGKLISSEFAQIAQNYETKGDLTDAELAFTLHALWIMDKIKTFHCISLVHLIQSYDHNNRKKVQFNFVNLKVFSKVKRTL